MRRTSRRKILQAAFGIQPRSGATLVEVLMSLLIMSVGIVSVFSLFPLSILSSVRATQLTHGRIHFDNVPELLRTIPEMVGPPVHAGYPDVWNSPTSRWRSTWKPNTSYQVGDIVTPVPASGNLFPLPYVALRCMAPTMGAARSGSSEPVWDVNRTEQIDGVDGLQWEMISVPNYVIDPIGFHRGAVTSPAFFGNRDAVGETASIQTLLPRRQKVSDTEKIALEVLASPDSWSVDLTALPLSISTSGSGTTVTFSSNLNFEGLSIDRTRAVFSSVDGTRRLTRFLRPPVTGAELNIDAPIPLDFLGPARIETYTPRYSCFIAVRNRGFDSLPTAYCVVCFNRQSSAESEHAYLANFGNSSFNAVADLADRNLRSDQVRIVWIDGNEPDPLLKEGGYMMDARNSCFYRVTGVQRSGDTATLTLNQSIPYDSMTTNATGAGYAIFLPGIIHVYEFQ